MKKVYLVKLQEVVNHAISLVVGETHMDDKVGQVLVIESGYKTYEAKGKKSKRYVEGDVINLDNVMAWKELANNPDKVSYSDLQYEFNPTFKDFMDRVRAEIEKYESLRLGQAMFNIAEELAMDMGRIRGTDADPFYFDWAIPRFVKALWDKEEMLQFRDSKIGHALTKKYGSQIYK